MSQVLYRKYRPKTFSELVGQDHVAKTLENQIKNGRIVHSYLFTGSRGIGKTTIARLLSKSLNCTGRGEEEAEPCNKCEHCKAMELGNALNIIEIDAASHTGVDNVRDKIIENVRFAPSGAKYKVFIIDEVHMLSTSAFNALLKTLEEPPSYAIFILATTELHKIPATILSRCQRFDFKKPTVPQIVERLEKLASLEKVKIEKNILERIAYLSEGGLRDAESLLGQILGLGIKDIKENDADLVLPKSDFSLALEFLSKLVNKNGREAIIIVQDLVEKGINFKYFIDNVIELTRKLLYLKITGEKDVLLTDDMNITLNKLQEVGSQEDIIKILDIVIARRRDLDNLDIPSLPLELAVAEICGEGNHESIKAQEHKSTLAVVVPRQSDNKIKATNINKISEKISISSGDISQIEEGWSEVLEKIKSYNHSLPFVLNTAKPTNFDGKNLVLAIKFKLHKDKLDDPKNKSILTNVLKSVYNMDIEVQTEVDNTLEVTGINDEEVDVASEFAA